MPIRNPSWQLVLGLRSATALLLATVLLSGCATRGEPQTAAAPAPTVASTPVSENYALDNLHAVLWQRTAAEAHALGMQAYTTATAALERALADPNWTAATEQTGAYQQLPPAVIVDVDETVLDTSAYMVERIRLGKAFDPASWAEYVAKADAPAIPGALAFLSHAHSRGVTVFYLSNREAKGEAEHTRKNLAALGFPNTADLSTFVFRDSARGWREKSPRRAEIAKTHRILLMAGDNFYDFVDVPDADRGKREAALHQYRAWWGTRWFVLPNPMYGSWESVILGHTPNMTLEARRAKLAALGLSAAQADEIARGGFER